MRRPLLCVVTVVYGSHAVCADELLCHVSCCAVMCVQVLFTVVSREEKYSAKLVIDTVIQRLGDALAAAVFQVLGESGAFLWVQMVWEKGPGVTAGCQGAVHL